MARAAIHVAAGAVTASDGRVLIAERPPGKYMAGHWEFPGGKLEPGETGVQGLARELWEEIGITIREPRPLMRVRHAYDFGEVLIDMWVVTRYSGEPQSLDGQRLRWCLVDDLWSAGLLAADMPIIRALRLPDRLTSRETPAYFLGKHVISDPRLRGTFCSSVAEGISYAHREEFASEFLVMRRMVSLEVLSLLCEAVHIPVYGSGIDLEQAWAHGATGVSDIPC